MTTHEARKILETIKFLNHKFELRDHMGAATLVITVKAPDTRNRSSVVKVMHESAFHLDMIADANHLVLNVFEALTQTLKHEAAELFFVGELLPFDEHHGPKEQMRQQELIKAMFSHEPEQNNRPYRQDRH